MSCQNCPCSENCLGWPIFCQWAAENPPDPVRILHIRNRSAMGPTPMREPAHPSVVESAELLRRMHGCPFRSIDSGCGCSGARCALRAGAIVSHIDCMDCARTYP